MGDAATELPHGFHFLCLTKRLLRNFSAINLLVEPLGSLKNGKPRSKEKKGSRHPKRQITYGLAEEFCSNGRALDCGSDIHREPAYLAVSDAALTTLRIRGYRQHP